MYSATQKKLKFGFFFGGVGESESNLRETDSRTHKEINKSVSGMYQTQHFIVTLRHATGTSLTFVTFR